MNTRTLRSPLSLALPGDTPAAARTVLRLLGGLQHGQLTLQLPGGAVQHFGAHDAPLHAQLHLHDWTPFSAALKSGDIGFAEAWIDGRWSTPDLPVLLRVLAANRPVLDEAIFGRWWGRLAYRLRHLMRRNTRANSRKNIHAHYDLGNDFYRLWLDETMNYSSAWFAGDAQRKLPEAQHAKVQRVLQQARVQPGSRVLEIGCGWGALAEAAASAGAQLTGVTLSTEQLAWARERLAKAGLQADLRLQDYRDIADGPYDAICSVEMIEAVGREWWPTYFRSLKKLLAPGGRVCLQSIVIRDELFERYLQGTDFIQQYIFPGGCLPSPEAIRREAAAAGLKVVDAMAFGPDYARTCALWRERFLARRAEAAGLGFDERFQRTWEFYLAYCEAGFTQGDIDVLHVTLAHDD
ncbi:class I SAM-dependent methyltransferase [Ideonella sp. 4Y11]|uniref:Class I SAM-dependent methyltransferase n=1 Tax=Ideonella aquatica TaxID=2824119 RepID=A0A940YHB3_9BURK|nr:cyclopropane-fatty-acyl-phospholipid synthase family protein [Ideonella aquatica]MBQ0960110.1 class I SAM-dependent methyltransferase [Ideonella aquatica]